jgi:hypothetical protein
MKLLGIVLILIGLGSLAFAADVQVPEISPASASTAVCLLSGALLVARGRRKK